MSMSIERCVVNERDVQEQELPGRMLRWVITPDTNGPSQCASCVIRVMPGQCVRPAHEHPASEELLYIVSGNGEVLIDGESAIVSEGTEVFFPTGSVHMLRNTGQDEMKVVCFYAPPTTLAEYVFHTEADFPANKEDTV